MSHTVQIPVVDISDIQTEAGKLRIAEQISRACKEHGFFYISGHGVDEKLIQQLKDLSAQFFAQPDEDKMSISMNQGGKAWRGFFPVNGELTSGKPDLKEGIYFGAELGDDHPDVQNGTPLHGKNLFTTYPEGFKDVVLEYMNQVTQVGHLVLNAIALSLGLEEDYFYKKCTQDPLILFRIFHYPPQPQTASQWGVGEHTDYGLLTILLQDEVGGLQVKSLGRWMEAPPIKGTFVCNIGDMLDRMTGGLYRSTPHRVLNKAGVSRYSFPLFFDPGYHTLVERIEGIEQVDDDRNERWDQASVHDFSGTYGQYLMRKIGKVFPDLGKEVL